MSPRSTGLQTTFLVRTREARKIHRNPCIARSFGISETRKTACGEGSLKKGPISLVRRAARPPSLGHHENVDSCSARKILNILFA